MASVAVGREPLVGPCRSRLRDAQNSIRERFLAEGDAPCLLHERCQLIDAVLGDLWRELDLPTSLALVARGYYGRGVL